MIKKLKTLGVVSTLFISSLCSADEIKHSLGFGIQYGGLGGWQIANVSDHGVSRLSLGVFGVTVGQDFFITDNVSVGAQLFGNVFSTGGGLSLNYYLGPKDQSNLVIGLDVFTAKETLEGIAGSTVNGYENNAFISFGYRF